MKTAPPLSVKLTSAVLLIPIKRVIGVQNVATCSTKCEFPLGISNVIWLAFVLKARHLEMAVAKMPQSLHSFPARREQTVV